MIGFKWPLAVYCRAMRPFAVCTSKITYSSRIMWILTSLELSYALTCIIEVLNGYKLGLVLAVQVGYAVL